jgi:hypothetical protein
MHAYLIKNKNLTKNSVSIHSLNLSQEFKVKNRTESTI